MEADAEETQVKRKRTSTITATEVSGIEVVCRLCANQSTRVIGIYSEEGSTNDLANKMNTYLPVKVSETDTLPLNCCWNCASTVLAWHELYTTSIEADKRLRDEFSVALTKVIDEEPVSPAPIAEAPPDVDMSSGNEEEG